MHSVPSHSASKPHDSDYSRNRARSIRFLILLAAILALAFFLSLRAGSYNTPAAELIRGIFGRASDAKINLVIRNNRLPRICTAMVAGAGLGLAGCILQAVLRNPLASASTLGVSQGATFGAAVAIIGLGLSQAGSWAIPLCSFLGSLLVAAVILGLSQFKQISSEGIVLAGVHQLHADRRDHATAILCRRGRALVARILDVRRPRQHGLAVPARHGAGRTAADRLLLPAPLGL